MQISLHEENLWKLLFSPVILRMPEHDGQQAECFPDFYPSLLSMFYLSCRLSVQGADTSIDLPWLFLTHLQLQKENKTSRKSALLALECII